MNRRIFFKSVGLSALTLPLVGFGGRPIVPQRTELDSLYDYLESYTIVHPIEGVIPFKLHPFQKDILKTIHENDNVIIVKARQIGMTTLLAGYAAWMSYQRQTWNCYNGINCDNNHYYSQIRNRFCGMPNNEPEYKPFAGYSQRNNDDKEFWLFYYDEFNWKRSKFCSKFFNLPLKESNRKNVVCGTPDPKGVLKAIINNPKNSSWKVVHYPATKCYPLWHEQRIMINRCIYSNFNDPNWFRREILAQFV